MSTPLPRTWTAIAVRTGGGGWMELPRPVVPLDAAPAMERARHIATRTRRERGREIYEVRGLARGHE